MKRILLSLALLLCPLAAQAADDSLYIEDMTWMEIRDRVQAGANIAIIPTGGTEQNGPHIVVGKHNMLVRYTAGEIARKLGNALVAPVIAFVPEGRIDPPEGHMQFPGTISVSDETFAKLLEDVAGSMKQHGFRLICFIGDHGGSQEVQKAVAAKLTSRWQSSGVRVLHVANYYGNNGQEKWVESMGIKVPNPQAHAGFADTSEMMVVNVHGVRDNLRGAFVERDYKLSGAMGSSTLSSPNYGRQLLNMKIQAAVEQITNASSR